MNLSQIDLRLLIVFDAVMSERNVTRAAERVGLSQPAVSNALKRLRYVLADELFERSAEGMRPTPRARQIAGPVREALHRISEALEPPTFDPRTSNHTFTLAMSDQVGVVLLPLMAKCLEKEAPSVDIRIRPKIDHEVLNLLETHDIDFAVGVFGDLPEHLDFCRLYSDRHVCMMRRGNPLAARPLTMDSFLSATHLLVRSAAEATGIVDLFVGSIGLHRRIAITTNQVLTVPAIIGQTDHITTLLQRTADAIHGSHGLHMVPLPFEVPPLDIKLVWHRATERLLPFSWLRGLIASLGASSRGPRSPICDGTSVDEDEWPSSAPAQKPE